MEVDMGQTVTAQLGQNFYVPSLQRSESAAEGKGQAGGGRAMLWATFCWDNAP